MFALSTGSAAHANSLDDAYKVCDALRNTRMVSECEVKVRILDGNVIDARIDTTGLEAQRICDGIGGLLKGVTGFTEPWELRIFSPFSGDHPVATCALPQGPAKSSARKFGSQSDRPQASAVTKAPTGSVPGSAPLPLIAALGLALVMWLLFLRSVVKNEKPKLMRQDALAQRVCVQCCQAVAPRLPGSGWIELILWLCYLVPGLIYSIWRRSEGAIICPYCKTPTMVPVHSPAGQAILSRMNSGGR